MQQTSFRAIRGFSLIELLIAMGLGTVVLSGALVLTSQAVGINDMVSQRSDMQQNGRVAMNLISRDLSLAGTGFRSGGIQLPTGTPSQDPSFACDPSQCYILNNAYPQDRLFAVTPGDGKGPQINGVQTDVITLAYRDSTSNFDQNPLVDINPAGTIVTFDPSTTPPDNDPVVGLKVGDILVLTNSNGSAAAVVTGLPVSGIVQLGANDPLQYNQPNAAAGNVKTILSPPPTPDFPPTSAFRVYVITYYIDASNPDSTKLMRQVNAHPPVPVAEDVEDLQFTYDIFDENTAVATSDLPDAGGTPNQIREISITLRARSPAKSMVGNDFQHFVLTTSVGPRNLIYRDRYQ